MPEGVRDGGGVFFCVFFILHSKGCKFLISQRGLVDKMVVKIKNVDVGPWSLISAARLLIANMTMKWIIANLGFAYLSGSVMHITDP
jgi:hypothetical protein